jgi:CheY-like chemotaxis protein
MPVRVLVIDDHRETADSIAAVLTDLGCSVLVVLNGAEALKQAPEFMPELILLDLVLPDADGYAIARSIRSSPWGRDVTLVAVTGVGQEEERSKSIEAGFDRHLMKPVQFSELEELVDVRTFLRSMGRA